MIAKENFITETEGAIISAHCSGWKAGQAESCSHVTSAMMYIEKARDESVGRWHAHK